MFSPLSRIRTSLVVLAASALALAGCSNPVLDDEKKFEEDAIVAVKNFIQTNLDDLAAASEALQAAAPAPDADGWNAKDDAAAIEAMKAEWKKARIAYERIEGAIAVVFPDLDHATDARYEDYIETKKDENLFDDKVVTGVHGIERILWSDRMPPTVVAFEKKLDNYKEAAFPATQQEADDFKNKLCALLVADTKAMSVRFQDLALDAPSSYRGVIGSINEQVEKISKAATGEEESRYAQFTLGDMRANIAAALTTYEAFQPWLLSKDGGEELDKNIQAEYDALIAAYDAAGQDSLPLPPDGWSSESPTAEHLETPFGKLFQTVQRASDQETDGALAHEMLESADLLGIANLPE